MNWFQREPCPDERREFVGTVPRLGMMVRNFGAQDACALVSGGWYGMETSGKDSCCAFFRGECFGRTVPIVVGCSGALTSTAFRIRRAGSVDPVQPLDISTVSNPSRPTLGPPNPGSFSVHPAWSSVPPPATAERRNSPWRSGLERDGLAVVEGIHRE